MEISYVNKITGFVIALVLGAIMIGGMLAPTVAGIQETVQPITKTNESYEYVSLSNGDVNVTYDTGTFKVNDIVQNVPATNGQILFACDYLIVWFNGTVPYGSYVNQASGIRNIAAFDITVSESKLTASVTYDNNLTQTVTDQAISFSFYYDTTGEYSVFDMRYTSPYISKDADVTAVGTYYTGTNKTFYWYYNGVANGVSEDYTYSIDIQKSKTTGTNDIYNVTAVTYDISGETFTPFCMIVPKEIAGHATSGPAYAMFGVITLLAIVMLVVIAANAVKGKYN